tara:strand:- start:689 stop:850 length:162 start_codon:yes stop_codon:yes gene_type:complete
MNPITIKLLLSLAGWIIGCISYALFSRERDWEEATNDIFMAGAYTIMLIFLLP